MTTIKIRRGVANDWTTVDPILADGEPGFELDTGKMKVGDGSRAWTMLPYHLPEDFILNLINDRIAGTIEPATMQEMQDGSDQVKYATAAGVKQETLALREALLGGADAAFDTLQELKVAIEAAEETSAIESIISQLSTKADDADVADSIKSAPGVGGFLLIRNGIDTPTGAPNEVILEEYSTSGGGSSSPGAGIDIPSGHIGGSVSDISALAVPVNGAAEAGGGVLILAANVLYAVRFKNFDTVLHQLKWRAAPDSAAAVASEMAVVDGDTGLVLKQTLNTNVTPATIATTGSDGGWTLGGGGLSGLPSSGKNFVLLLRPSAQVRLISTPAPAAWVNIPGKKTAGQLIRAASKTMAMPAEGATFDLAQTGWTNRPVLYVAAFRNS